MKNSLLIKRLMLDSGVMSLWRKFNLSGKTAILRYHSIVDPEENYYASPSICITPYEFEAQVRYLSKYYDVISLDTVCDCVTAGLPLPLNSVVFTFDDGYRDNYLAYKILKKYNAHGTFYIASGCIENKESLWLFEVIYLINSTSTQRLHIELSDKNMEFLLFTKENRSNTIRKITEIIKSNNLSARESIRRQLRSQTEDVKDFHEKSEKVMLSWDQVHKMSDNGMVIGGHTVTHLNLPNANPKDAVREINECKRAIENQIGRDVRHFSYPNGGNYDYYNQSIMEMVRDAGFSTASTSNNGIVDPKNGLLELNRIRVTAELPEIIYQMHCEPFINNITGKVA